VRSEEPRGGEKRREPAFPGSDLPVGLSVGELAVLHRSKPRTLREENQVEGCSRPDLPAIRDSEHDGRNHKNQGQKTSESRNEPESAEPEA